MSHEVTVGARADRMGEQHLTTQGVPRGASKANTVGHDSDRAGLTRGLNRLAALRGRRPRRRAARRLAVLAVTLPVLGLSAAAAPAGAASLYWGAIVDGVAPTPGAFAPGGAYYNYEHMVGKRMSMIQWGQPWKRNGVMQPFQRSYFNNVRAHGSIPVLNWASWSLGSGINQSSFQLRDIYSGAYDGYITRWATDAKNWGHPLMLRFNHEMNGWWYPWGEGRTSSGAVVNGNSAGDFVKAWRHVHDIFTRVGARNVSWLWNPNMQSRATNYAPLWRLYPGNAYVDWTGLSLYNKGSW